MPPSTDYSHVEFIRLNGHAVRATSWQALEPAGTYRLVAIVRGSGDAAALVELLESPVLELEIADERTSAVVVQSLERRETGTAPATITRLVVEFAPAGDAEAAPAPELTLEDRVEALEREVARLRTMLVGMSNATPFPRFDQLS